MFAICEICKQQFKTFRNAQKFCGSYECNGINMKRLWKNPEYRKNQSKKHKGLFSGNKNPAKLPEVAKKISEAGRKRIGNKNSCWRGGRTSLWQLIRGLEEYTNWRIEVFKQNNYTCQKCGDNKGHNLNAHHKKSFQKILDEFLQYYSQFSPLEEKSILARLAITYEPFWNISNGITLCEDCHKNARQKLLTC